MKNLIITTFIVLNIAINVNAQALDSFMSVQKTDTIIKPVKNQDNLLDMQTKTFTSLFGENLDGNTSGNPIGYLELLNKLDLPEQQKTEMRNLYYLQASSELSQKQKDSIGKAFGKMLQEAQNREE